MAMSASEKSRRYRQRRDQDPQRREAYLKKEKACNEKKKIQGLLKPVRQLSRRDQKAKKKYWRDTKRKERLKKKALKDLPLSPPMSPESEREVPACSRQLQDSRKRRNRMKAKCYHENKKLKQDLEKEKRRTEKYRKRLIRLENNTKSCSEDTPRKRSKRQLRSASKKTVRRTILFHYAMMDQLRQKYSKANRNEKKTLLSLVRGNILRKYKLRTNACKEIGICSKGKKYFREKYSWKELSSVKNFYLRDDNSQITTGSKQTVTLRKEKRQKRLLCDSVKNLHEKFLSENVTSNLKYNMFRKLKPFWVKHPSEAERNTCLCKLHENFRMIVMKLHYLKIFETSALDKVLESTVCETTDKSCMYGECDQCSDFSLNLKGIDLNQNVSWQQWRSEVETRYLKNVGEKQIKVTKLVEESGFVSDIIEHFYQHLPKFKQHSYNIRNQFQYFRELKRNLGRKECLVHVDFSENFQCKMHSEIQSMHFGASKKQITLHTGVIYTSSSQETFCSVSDNLEHGPAAIWAHLHPVLQEIHSTYPEVETINFFSDGPTTQYRQKGNFFLLATELFNHNFKDATWNFFEAGHGKGAPDGVGGALKRRANELVRFGADIMDAASFFTTLQEEGTSVKLHLISNKDIMKKTKAHAKKNLQPVIGTMKIHQILTNEKGIIYHRDVSCLCNPENPCIEHKPQRHSFPNVKHKASNNENTDSDVSRKRQKCDRTENDSMFDSTSKQSLPSTSTISDEQMIELDENGNDRPAYFKRILDELSSCKTFPDLHEKCIYHESCLNYGIEGEERYIMDGDLEVDRDALELYPNDVPFAPILFPMRVSGDGDCLAHAGSVFAFGHEHFQDEVRVRLAIELVLYKKKYLSHDYLVQGIIPDKKNQRNLAGNFALYSESFNPDVPFNADTIETMYENETMTITHPKKYCGIWQMFALASVLGIKLYSIYPKLGNKNVRMDMHRMIHPRILQKSGTIHIMWTTTRCDMNPVHWVPNHFVPVMAIDTCSSSIQQSPVPDVHNHLKESPVPDADKHLKESPVPDADNHLKESPVPDVDNHLKESPIPDADNHLKESPVPDADDHLKESPVPDADNYLKESPVPDADNHLKESPVPDADDHLKESPVPDADNYLKESPVPDADDNFKESPVPDADAHLKESPVPDADDHLKESPVPDADDHLKESPVPDADDHLKESPVLDADDHELPFNCDQTSNDDVKQKLYELKESMSLIDDLLGKYVVVLYEGNPYPGKVLDIDEQNELYVECMHQVTKVPNCFFWPSRIKDRCWYSYDNVLAVIPQPTAIAGSRHKMVDSKIWNTITEYLDINLL